MSLALVRGQVKLLFKEYFLSKIAVYIADVFNKHCWINEWTKDIMYPVWKIPLRVYYQESLFFHMDSHTSFDFITP